MEASMCMGRSGPPYGIPIEEETHDLYSDELKAAWIKFDKWFKKERNRRHGLVDRSLMPSAVKQAYDLIKATPIPGYDSSTGADSCYIIGIESLMTSPE